MKIFIFSTPGRLPDAVRALASRLDALGHSVMAGTMGHEDRLRHFPPSVERAPWDPAQTPLARYCSRVAEFAPDVLCLDTSENFPDALFALIDHLSVPAVVALRPRVAGAQRVSGAQAWHLDILMRSAFRAHPSSSSAGRAASPAQTGNEALETAAQLEEIVQEAFARGTQPDPPPSPGNPDHELAAHTARSLKRLAREALEAPRETTPCPPDAEIVPSRTGPFLKLLLRGIRYEF